MIDRWALAHLRPALDAGARGLAARGVGADAVTLAGLVLGLAGAACIAAGRPLAGLVLIVAGRIADGLDGAVARLTRPTDRGAYFDIVADFVFYAAVPLAFAVSDPAANALAAAVLLAGFIGTGSSFLAFAVLAERRGLANARLPNKGFFYLGGLTEGGETIACFVLMCLVPQHFAAWAYGFAVLCLVTLGTRVVAGAALLARPVPPGPGAAGPPDPPHDPGGA
jgi:phosphatidylglycerophosphate synthase